MSVAPTTRMETRNLFLVTFGLVLSAFSWFLSAKALSAASALEVLAAEGKNCFFRAGSLRIRLQRRGRSSMLSRSL